MIANSGSDYIDNFDTFKKGDKVLVEVGSEMGGSEKWDPAIILNVKEADFEKN